jgi:hypothetical protein
MNDVCAECAQKSTLIHRLTTGGNSVEIVSWTHKSVAMINRTEPYIFPTSG